jgi:hypothetical protein
LPGARILPGRTVLLTGYGVGVRVRRRIEIVELDEELLEWAHLANALIIAVLVYCSNACSSLDWSRASIWEA